MKRHHYIWIAVQLLIPILSFVNVHEPSGDREINVVIDAPPGCGHYLYMLGSEAAAKQGHTDRPTLQPSQQQSV